MYTRWVSSHRPCIVSQTPGVGVDCPARNINTSFCGNCREDRVQLFIRLEVSQLLNIERHRSKVNTVNLTEKTFFNAFHGRNSQHQSLMFQHTVHVQTWHTIPHQHSDTVNIRVSCFNTLYTFRPDTDHTTSTLRHSQHQGLMFQHTVHVQTWHTPHHINTQTQSTPESHVSTHCTRSDLAHHTTPHQHSDTVNTRVSCFNTLYTFRPGTPHHINTQKLIIEVPGDSSLK